MGSQPAYVSGDEDRQSEDKLETAISEVPCGPYLSPLTSWTEQQECCTDSCQSRFGYPHSFPSPKDKEAHCW